MDSSNKNKLTRRKTIFTSASTVVLLSAITPVVPVFASENVADSLSPNNFSDVYKSNDHANAIRTLAMNGIAKGYPDYTFAPYQALTMSDALKFLGRYVEKNGDRFSGGLRFIFQLSAASVAAGTGVTAMVGTDVGTGDAVGVGAGVGVA